MGYYLPEKLIRLDLQCLTKREYGIDRGLLFASFNLKKVFPLERRKVRKDRLAHPAFDTEFFKHCRNRFR